MNKILLSMPNTIINSYLQKNYKYLNEEDALALLNKGILFPDHFISHNKNLRKSQRILNYMIKYEPNRISLFSERAFDNLNMSRLAHSDYVPSLKDIKQLPILLTDELLAVKTISKRPEVISLLDPSRFSNQFIHKLEKSNYIPSKKALEKYDMLQNSLILTTRAVKNDPTSLVSLKKLNPSLVTIALENGYEPIYEDFDNNSNFQNSGDLLLKAFKTDPAVIAMFPEYMTNYDTMTDAVDRGFIASENDLIKNPILRDDSYVMEVAIKNDPSLIRYLTKHTLLGDREIVDAMKDYHLSEQDLKNYPELCHIASVMENVDPSLRIYDANFPVENKKEIITDLLKKNRILNLSHLPFFDPKFGGKSSSVDIMKVAATLFIDIDEKNIDEQEKYYELLDKIVDGIVNIRYNKAKKNFDYSSIDQIDQRLIESFEIARKTKDRLIIKSIATELSNFSFEENQDVCISDYITNEVNRLFDLYVQNEKINQHESLDFYNYLLNEKENSFKSKTKEHIIMGLKSQMELTEKRKNSLLLGRKLEEVTKHLQAGNYDYLNISKELLLFNAQTLRRTIHSLKELKKHNIELDSSQFEQLENMFVKGQLTVEEAQDCLKIDKKYCKLIVDKYNQQKIPLTKVIPLVNDDLLISVYEKQKLGYNYNNFVIANTNQYYSNVAELLLNATQDNVTEMLHNQTDYYELLPILPFTNLFSEFNTFDLIDILSNYSRVKKNTTDFNFDHSKDSILNEENNDSIISYNKKIINHFDSLLQISNGYASSDDIGRSILGDNVIRMVHESNSKQYLDFYLKMFKRSDSFIPPVKGTYDNYIFESGNHKDTERLLIGKYCYGSCITLENLAGNNTYNRVLQEKDGDVIMITDKNTTDFVARMLMFRQGNIVRIAPLYGISTYTKKEVLKEELLTQVADQIIDSSIKAGDNIEYVFMDGTAQNLSKEKYHFESNKNLNSRKYFPHADLNDHVYLIGAKDPSNMKTGDLSRVDLHCSSTGYYQKKRNPIKTDASDKELSRLNALRILLEPDINKRAELAYNHENFERSNCHQVVSGEDWYIAIHKDNTMEELLVPTSDKRSVLEFEQAKETLLQKNISQTRLFSERRK